MNADDQKYVRAKMQAIGNAVKKEVPGYGFITIIFPFNDHAGRCNYVSNAMREDVVAVLKEWIERNDLPSKKGTN